MSINAGYIPEMLGKCLVITPHSLKSSDDVTLRQVDDVCKCFTEYSVLSIAMNFTTATFHILHVTYFFRAASIVNKFEQNAFTTLCIQLAVFIAF